ncbi:hypothetical protein [Streptomyces xantholiticus]|uniref:hypothetical protein n=1 Tax=Streptomyces xantholiticus TaxID=68285 RepID=UPI00167832A2|nr:hypothetical protein [Streptomyces xantholiticus]GGW41252.1 hypothetical protein GCM10010381_27630 [Streptomyces xantholiticus]
MSYQRYVERRGANHGLHVVLSILTCGIWAITGWPLAAIIGRRTVTKVPVYQPPQVMPPQQPYGYPQQPPQAYPPQQYGQQYYPQQPGPYGQPPRQ